MLLDTISIFFSVVTVCVCRLFFHRCSSRFDFVSAYQFNCSKIAICCQQFVILMLHNCVVRQKHKKPPELKSPDGLRWTHLPRGALIFISNTQSYTLQNVNLQLMANIKNIDWNVQNEHAQAHLITPWYFLLQFTVWFYGQRTY